MENNILKKLLIAGSIAAGLILNSCFGEDSSEKNKLIATWRNVKGMGHPRTNEIDITSDGTEDIRYTQNLYWDISEERLCMYQTSSNAARISDQITDEECTTYAENNLTTEILSEHSIHINIKEKILTLNPSTIGEERYTYTVDPADLTLISDDLIIFEFKKEE